jgi:hypothetical protein
MRVKPTDPTRTAVSNGTRVLGCSLTTCETRQGGYQCSDSGGSSRACGDADDAVDGRRHARGGSNRSRSEGVGGGGGCTAERSGGAFEFSKCTDRRF